MALFVLTVRGTSTDAYGLVYLVQISLGAAVALGLTLAFPPLPLQECFHDRADRYLAGAVAVTARRCLRTYTGRHER